MRQKIISNIISSGVEKVFLIGVQLIASIILIRLLPRDDYGIIGVVAGYYAFVNVINISMESIILRDHGKYDDDLPRFMQSFFVFNLAKSVFFLLIAMVLSLFLSSIYARHDFVYAIFSISFILIADSMTAPLVIFAASKFNQKLVTKISLIRAGLNLVFLGGLFIVPTLAFIALKDLIVSLVFIVIWFVVADKYLSVSFSFRQKGDWSFIRDSFVSYSLWTHLNGVVTNVIYRSDTFFLSLFAGLTIVGNYNIALNSGNIANILPMIIGYQNSVALSHAKEKEQIFKISNAFIRLSLLIGLFTLIGFLVAGHWYLWLITGDRNCDEIFFYMMCIVTGLVIVKSIASPLVAFLNIHGSVDKLVIRVTIPILFISLPIYFCGAYLYQAKGLALSNIIIAFCWLILVIIEVKRNGYCY
jgi:O-antigen/teichoic acid export membrane protein